MSFTSPVDVVSRSPSNAGGNAGFSAVDSLIRGFVRDICSYKPDHHTTEASTHSRQRAVDAARAVVGIARSVASKVKDTSSDRIIDPISGVLIDEPKRGPTSELRNYLNDMWSAMGACQTMTAQLTRARQLNTELGV
ncbi:hypothetical protein Moror_5597 [Moniliophthora roreri MCA 2997]|uniref:Uncharacterized protein n=1 Tax=Moniliophthora roreri (strain MCA 2997) TaxID=1381753 RepID=V2X2V1_MONRO|nr:hypothetical protein Moror_5597 [Moniliophthora roreri MCA 2997]